MRSNILGTLVAAAALLAGAAPALAQAQPAPPPPPAPQAARPMAPAMAPNAPRRVRRTRRMSCTARMNQIRLAWERMPASETKNQVAAAYNEANHARKAGNEVACQAAIANIQLAQ
jgi:hypothetical protein